MRFSQHDLRLYNYKIAHTLVCTQVQGQLQNLHKTFGNLQNWPTTHNQIEKKPTKIEPKTRRVFVIFSNYAGNSQRLRLPAAGCHLFMHPVGCSRPKKQVDKLQVQTLGCQIPCFKKCGSRINHFHRISQFFFDLYLQNNIPVIIFLYRV